MSILGVALGVGALVLALRVYNGLTTDMRDKISWSERPWNHSSYDSPC